MTVQVEPNRHRTRAVLALLIAALGVSVLPASATAAVTVEKTASPTSLPVPGGEFRFKVKVTNTGPNAYRIASITDDIYGDLRTRAGSDCAEIIDQAPPLGPPTPGQGRATLFPPGHPDFSSTAKCTFTGSFTGAVGDQQTDTVTVTAGNIGFPQTLTPSDTATVAITAKGTKPGAVTILDPDEITCKHTPADIVGTSGADDLVGTSGPDVIAALGGDDTVRGRGGKDRLCGGRGDDELRGGAENDRLNGGAGDDFCNGGGGNNDTAVACQEVVGVP